MRPILEELNAVYISGRLCGVELSREQIDWFREVLRDYEPGETAISEAYDDGYENGRESAETDEEEIRGEWKENIATAVELLKEGKHAEALKHLESL